MKGSVGMDLAEISRIRKAMENPRFLLEFFTENERAYITARHTPEQSAAGAWAAKEAFSKAVGTGVRGWSLREVEVLHDPLGQPVLRLHGRAAQQFSDYAFSLSISHTDTMAAAVVLAEKQGGK